MKMGKWWMVMVLVVVLVGGIWEEVKAESAAASMISEEACKEEQREGIKECKPVVFGADPSPACCGRVRVTHFECVCPLITPKLAALIDVNKLASLIQGCGRTVPRHFKCGGIFSSSSSFLLHSFSYPPYAFSFTLPFNFIAALIFP